MSTKRKYNLELFEIDRQVNNQCDHVKFLPSCICCPNAMLIASPYVVFNGERTYGCPARIQIGQFVGFHGPAEPLAGWEDLVKNHGFSEIVIELIRERLTEKDFSLVEAEQN